MSDITLPCGLPPLSDQRGFLDYWMHSAGLSKVPQEFHLFTGMSALAACMADRVHYEKWIDEKLYPNLYVMLIGGSGVGKNQAWRRAIKRIEGMPADAQKQVNLYRGKVTAEKLLTRLSNKKVVGSNKVWLVTPELKMQVGTGPRAEGFVTHMTELMDADQTVQDDTRTSGHFHAINPTINWGSGTTQDWLLSSVGKTDILGGFFARICGVPGFRATTRYAKPIYPDDAREVNAYLTAYLAHVTQYEGPFTISPEADEYHAWWYDNRVEPDNPLLWNYYEHGDNMVYKFAMVLAMSDHYQLEASYWHMVGAITLYEWLYAQLPTILEFAHRTPDVERLEMISGMIESAPFVDYKRLLRVATTRGLTREQLGAILQTLVERGDVSASNFNGVRSYRWIR